MLWWWWWWGRRVPASGSVLQSFPWSTFSARIKEDGRESSQRDMCLCFLRLRGRGSKMWMWKPDCAGNTVQERVGVLPGWRAIHSTHYLCHLQGSERLREGWNSPWPIGRDKQSGICHSWDIHRSTVQTVKAGQCSSETRSVYFSAEWKKYTVLYCITIQGREGSLATEICLLVSAGHLCTFRLVDEPLN